MLEHLDDQTKFKVIKLAHNIIKLTDQQSKHRTKLAEGCTDTYIKRFISVTNKLIMEDTTKMEKLLQTNKPKRKFKKVRLK